MGDDEGEVVATLTRYLPVDDPAALAGTPSSPRFVFLAIHGWNDYFYHTELAREVARSGGAFYAIDLRKYGRSLRDHQTVGFTTNLSDYDEDIAEALDVIFDAHSDLPLVMYGHSTGGLTAALWAHRHPGALAGLVLNSPWLELQGSTIFRHLTTPVLTRLAKLAPDKILPLPEDNGFYDRVLSAWRDEGEDIDETDPFTSTGWTFNRQWRMTPSPPIRAGWITAIMGGHAKVEAGLDITCPILVLTSAATHYSDTWSELQRSTDTVLDVEQIWRRVPKLGSITTLVRLENAIHDVLLSRSSVRKRAYGEMKRWLSAYVSAGPTDAGHL